VNAGTRLRFACNSSKILPWPGHVDGGLGCGGDTYTFWPKSMDPLCPFGSLVGKVGMSGASFCVCTNTPTTMPSTGALYLGFNDGESFADNSGTWTVTTTSEASQALPASAPFVGMPFAGRFNGRCQSAPDAHTVHDTGVSQWSTDLYAPPGTQVRFYVPSGYKGYVVDKSDTCGTSSGGQSLYVDIYNSANVKVGRALYSHLANVTLSVSFTTPITSSTLLGETSPTLTPSSCYQVDDPGDTHIHFELGTAVNLAGANKACWYDFNGQTVAAGTAIGRFGSTGLSARGPCP
jgi:hypothetical protein